MTTAAIPATTTAIPGLHIEAPVAATDNRKRVTIALAIFQDVLGIGLEEARNTLSTLPSVVTFDDIIHYVSRMRRLEAGLADDDQATMPDISLADALVLADQARKDLTAPRCGYICEVIEPGDGSDGAQDQLVRTLAKYIKNGTRGRHRVVLLRGKTGGGKTSKIRAATKLALEIEELGGEYLEKSIPTCQPEDLAGIPFPDPNDPRFFYYRMPREFMGVKVIFFDEANRAAESKTFDAMMQLVLERQINGTKFDEIQAIILAINPDDETGDYNVNTFDKAFWERIDHTIDVEYEYSAAIIGANMARLYEEDPGLAMKVAEIGVKWFYELGQTSKDQLNPRRLEKILWAYLMGENIETTLDRKGGNTVPLDKLVGMLGAENILTLDQLISDPDAVEERMKKGGREAADLQYRFVELMNLMARKHLRQQIVTVAHLFKYVKRDLIPRPDRDKRLWIFLEGSLKRYATDEQREAFFRILAERQKGLNTLSEELGKIGARLREGKGNELGAGDVEIEDVDTAADASAA